MHKHIYIKEIVTISDEVKELSKLLYSKVNSTTYNKFIIKEYTEYLRCVKCGKIIKLD